MAEPRADTRSHRSLMDDDKLLWLTNIPGELIPLVNPLLQEAEEFQDAELLAYCRRFLTLRTSIGGKRTEQVADVAKHDEALQDVPEAKVARRPKV